MNRLQQTPLIPFCENGLGVHQVPVITSSNSVIQLLGTPSLKRADSVTPLPDTLPARVLAFLALRQSAVSRSELAGIFFASETETVARQRLRLQLSRARKLPLADFLQTSAGFASFIYPTDVQELLQEAAGKEWAAISARPAPVLMAGWELEPGPLEEMQPVQARLTETWLLAVRRQAQQLATSGDSDAATSLLLHALAQEPAAESLLQLLLQVARPAGRMRDALQAYEAFAQLIAPLSPLPETRNHLDDGRNDGLPDPETIVALTAILAEHASPESIAEAANAPVASVVRVLGDLERSGRLDDRGRIRNPELLLGGLSSVELRYLHAQAARALSLAGQPLAEGEHWLLAGESERAVEAWFPAAAGLFGREIRRQDEALGFYQRILELDVRSDAWYAAAAYYASHLILQQEPEKARARIDQVLLESDNPQARTFALTGLARLQLSDGQIAQAAETIRLCELQLRKVDDLGLQRDVLSSQVMVLRAQGRLQDALEITARVLEGLRLEPPRHALLSWLAWQANLLCDVGDYEPALDSYREQVQLARRLGHTREEVRAAADILTTLSDMGLGGEEIETGLQALELGEFDVTWPLRLSVAEGLAALGRTAEAIGQLELIQAGNATVATRGHAHALHLQLAPETPGLAEAALQLGAATDRASVRIAVAAAVAGLGRPGLEAGINALLAGIDGEQVPAWLAVQWQSLAQFRVR